MQIPTMPLKILALAPFTFQQELPWSENPIELDRTNLDHVMENLGLSFYVSVPTDLCPEGGLEITCKGFKDLHPDVLIQNNAFLKNLLEARDFVEQSQKKGLSSAQMDARLKQWPNLPPIRIATESKEPKKPSASAVDDILKMVALPDEKQSTSAATHSASAQINNLLQQALGNVFSSEAFKNIEAVWRGVKLLLEQGQIDGGVKIQIVPVSLETLEQTLDNLTVNLVNDLPSLVIVDLPFDNSPRSIEGLEKIALFAETLLCPAVCWVTQRFLHLDSWEDLSKLSYLPHYLEEPPFAKWRSLAATPSARWLAVTCNRFLARFPYGPDNRPRLVPFQESQGLWASPVWALGSLISQSFVKTRWPTRFTDWHDIKLENLALDTSQANRPIATEASFAEERIDQFVRAGVTPLIGYRNKDIAFVLGEATVGKGSLSYQLFVSRITHFVLWCRDNFDKNLGSGELEERLTKALSLFWEQSNDPTPKSLEVSFSDPDNENRILVNIVVTPSRHVLPSGESVELGFYW